MRFRPLIFLALLSACASTADTHFRDPTLAEWQAADFGDEPGNYDQAIRSYLESLLQNPRSTTLTIKSGPTKTWVGTAPDFQFGFGICVDVLERGVYDTANFGPTFFLLHDDRVALMREGSDGERLCARLGRVPKGAED